MLNREARSTRLSALEPNTRYLICVLAVASWASADASTAAPPASPAATVPDAAAVNASRMVS